MAMAFRIMLFVLLFNLAAGILSVALEPYTIKLPVQYDDDGSSMGNFTVSPPGAEGASGWWDKFLDFLKIGFFIKLQNLLKSTIYGITEIFTNLGILDNAYVIYFNSIITIIYIIGIIDLFTARRLQN